MQNILRIIYAVGVLLILFFSWETVHQLIRGTFLSDFRIFAPAVVCFALLWIAEKGDQKLLQLWKNKQ